MSDQLDRLEAWMDGHKRRACTLNHDNGFGASCWVLDLFSEKPYVRCHAVRFVLGKSMNHCIFVHDGESDEPFPTAADVIKRAMDYWETI